MLWYYDISRRKLLQILGLSAAGFALSRGRVTAKMLDSDIAVKDTGETIHMNQLIARAVHDAGAGIVTCVPATGTAKIFDAYNALVSRKAPYSYNEEIAYTLAHSAGLTGRRSTAIIKAHGLAKASNSVIDSLTAGTTAGCVVIITYDNMGRHSDNIFDYLDFVKGCGIPFKVAQHHNVYDDILDCFRWSEELRLPVGILIDSSLLDETVQAVSRPSVIKPISYKRDPLLHILCPPLSSYQFQVLQAKLTGKVWQRVKRPPEPRVPDSLPPSWQKMVQDYVPLFEVFHRMRNEWDFVSGDTGISSMFAFPPYHCIDVCTYYGGSLPLAIGAYLAGRRGVWAVTGDYAFVAAGHMGLIEALSRDIPLKVLVLYNGCALTTGGQPIPEHVFNQLISGYAPYVTYLKAPGNINSIRSVLKLAAASNRMEIIVADYISGGE